MPLYTFRCDECNKDYEIAMRIAEHTEQKNKLTCAECHGKLTQTVAPLIFKLNGHGWASEGSANMESVGLGYGVSDAEFRQNLEQEKRIEDQANDFMAKDTPSA